ncbi:MAG: HlyD family type I secretion periplasmic adaptor subunit [Alphaproteobacteria bacterium]|nr:HlyD family type I secretion periplasmic adaptor subunit [Alphaproteobacteria bacterium]
MSRADGTLSTSIRNHLWGAGLFLCALLVFTGVWFTWMQISGAVIAPGAIVVESNVKTVKHKEGGIVSEIHVRDGDQVQAGDLLLRLQDTVTRANLIVVDNQLNERLATEARLLAERDGATEVAFPPSLMQQTNKVRINRILDGQRRLMKARAAGFDGRINQLREQIKQLESQTDGLEVQTRAKQEEIALIAVELGGLESLLADQYVSANRVYAVRRDRTRLTGEHGALITEAARTGLAISERRMQILQLQEDFRADVLQQLQDTRSEIARLNEQKTTAEDQLSRMDIRAPRSGYVHQLSVHTKGGVISAAEVILLVVPKGDSLLIEVQVTPTDVDQLFEGQLATIRLPGLNQRTTPELKGSVLTVSAETSRDDVTGLSYYTARLRLLDGEQEKLDSTVLIPGMPVEALIQTRERSILSYLIKPISDQIAHALREE